jgi:hypothetical protein
VLVSSKLFLFVEFGWCKTCHHFVALYFYSSQLWCVGLFFVFFKKNLSFCSHCCACVFYYWHMCFLSLIYTSENHDEQSSSSPILVFSQLFFCVVFCWCMHFVQHFLSLLHFVQMHIFRVPSIKKSFWVEENRFFKT